MNDNSIEYKMDKSSRIEFFLLSQIFENYLIKFDKRNNGFIENLLCMSLHSSQSVFETRDFKPISMSQTNKSHKVFNFKFSKTILKSLQWPHETDCKINTIDSKAEKQIMNSFEDCVNSCIFGKSYAKFKCIPIDGSLEIDLLLESRTRNFNLCNRNTTKTNKIDRIETFC
jgi:hypothetical protein